jgi:hypothetical protein
MSEVKNVMLEDKISKLENEIEKLKIELSIAIEFYAETREFLSFLIQLMKTKSELSYSKPISVLESTSYTTSSKPKSKIDEELDRVVNLIFKDYKDQFKE